MVEEFLSENCSSCSSSQIKRLLWFVIVIFVVFFDNFKPIMVLASVRWERKMVATFLVGRHNQIFPVLSKSINCYQKKKNFNDWETSTTYIPYHCQNQAIGFIRYLSDSRSKYDRFRSLLLKSASSDQLNCQDSTSKAEEEVSLPLAQEIISILAQKNRTWKRLRHIPPFPFQFHSINQR